MLVVGREFTCCWRHWGRLLVIVGSWGGCLLSVAEGELAYHWQQWQSLLVVEDHNDDFLEPVTRRAFKAGKEENDALGPKIRRMTCLGR